MILELISKMSTEELEGHLILAARSFNKTITCQLIQEELIKRSIFKDKNPITSPSTAMSMIDMTVGRDIQSIIDIHISVIEDFKASESRRIYAMNEYLNSNHLNE